MVFSQTSSLFTPVFGADGTSSGSEASPNEANIGSLGVGSSMSSGISSISRGFRRLTVLSLQVRRYGLLQPGIPCRM